MTPIAKGAINSYKSLGALIRYFEAEALAAPLNLSNLGPASAHPPKSITADYKVLVKANQDV